MGIRLTIYNLLVNRIPGIHSRYENFRQSHSGPMRYISWGYLFVLNFRYYALQDRSLIQAALSDSYDVKIRLQQNSESAVFSQCSPEQMAAQLSEADVVSFDVFDTLILRPYRKPEDLFWELELQLHYPQLKLLRQQAERQARAKKTGTNEVTLAEIWDVLSAITGIPADVGMDTEWRCELKSCFANPYFLDVVNQLKQGGKTLIICSDMYLSAEQIRTLLLHCGYPSFYRYFVSSEFQVSKSDGRLFDMVRSVIGDVRCIHVGDNPHSDFKQAMRKQFNAILYPNVHQAGSPWRPRDISSLIGSAYTGIVNTRIHNGSRQYSPAYELGFIYGGLFVTGFCQFIHRYVHANNIGRILFLSRDGEIIHKTYLQMYPEDESLCRYVWWSRLAATKMTARCFKNHYLTCMVHHKADAQYSIADCMRTMELEDLLDSFIACTNNLCRKDEPLTKKSAQLLSAFLQEHWDQLCAHYDEEIRLGGEYYSAQIGGASSAVAVDVGWVGSGPLLLRHMIENVWALDCRVTGIMAGISGQVSPDAQTTAAQRASGELVTYLFSDAHNRDAWKQHDPSLGHNLLLELILAATSPSFRGFCPDAQGNFQFNSKIEQIDSHSIQQGILDFAAAFAAHPFGQMDISGADAMAPIQILYRNSKWVRNLVADSEINANIE